MKTLECPYVGHKSVYLAAGQAGNIIRAGTAGQSCLSFILNFSAL